MNYVDVLIEPILSEKATVLRESGKYTFKVAPNSSKTQIKEAVHNLFNVKVVDCTTVNVSGKEKRVRGRPGRTASWKKAVISLAPGETIKVFEGL